MKKVLCLALAVILVLVCAGCGEKKEKTGDTAPKTVNTLTGTETWASAPAAEGAEQTDRDGAVTNAYVSEQIGKVRTMTGQKSAGALGELRVTRMYFDGKLVSVQYCPVAAEGQTASEAALRAELVRRCGEPGLAAKGELNDFWKCYYEKTGLSAEEAAGNAAALDATGEKTEAWNAEGSTRIFLTRQGDMPVVIYLYTEYRLK